MKIEVSNGEIIDKYTILEIKLSKIKDSKLISFRHTNYLQKYGKQKSDQIILKCFKKELLFMPTLKFQ